MSSQFSSALAVVLACSLAACGGGGGNSPTPNPSPTNRAPTLTASSAALSVAENSTGTLFTLAASDPDGDDVSLTLSGADASFFTLGSGGAVSFKSAPNYDRFADADSDNSYVVVAQASDGRGGTVRSNVIVTVTNEREGVRVTRIASGFDHPAGMDFGPVDNTLVIAETDGTIWSVSGRDGGRSVEMQIDLGSASEVIDVAFGRMETGTLLPGIVVMMRSDNGIFLLRNGANSFIDQSLASGPPEGATGALAFGPDGWLYAVVGDPEGTRAQGDSGYGRSFVPTDPYAGASLRGIPIRPAGRGIRQPGGLTAFGSGSLLFGDQADAGEHEISRFSVQPLNSSIAMLNFGWPFFTGTVQRNVGAPSGLISPTLVYPYGTGSRRGEGIVLGGFYAGSIASIVGKFVFGDRNGTIWAVPLAALQDDAIDRIDTIENRTEDFVPDQGTINRIVEIKADANGRIFILDGDGELFRVDAA